MGAGLHPVVDGRSTQAHLYDRDAARQLAAHLRGHSRNSHSHHHDVEIDAFAHRHGLRRRVCRGWLPMQGRRLQSLHGCAVFAGNYATSQLASVTVVKSVCSSSQRSVAHHFKCHTPAVVKHDPQSCVCRYLWTPSSMFQHVGVHSSSSGVETAAGDSAAKVAQRYQLLKVTRDWDAAQQLLRNLPGGERGASECGRLS